MKTDLRGELPGLGEALDVLDATHVRWRGRSLVYFGGCDYLRLAQHPALHRAARAALAREGLDVSASRKTTGNRALYEQLEHAIARFFAVEAAVLTSTGYTASLVAVQALAGEITHVLLDARAHSCLRDAAAVSGLSQQNFAHRSADDLARRLRACGRGARPLVMTDGLFGNDGSVAPLPGYLRLLPRRGVLLVDDAHAAGVLGAQGRGTPEWFGLRDSRLVQTITLSKAFGAYGGALLGSKELCRAAVEKSHAFAGGTPVPPPLAGAALRSLELLRASAARRHRLAANTRFIKGRLADTGLPSAQTPGPLVELVPNDSAAAARLKKRLLAAQIFPSLIRYPGGPAGGYFRFAISSEHRRTELTALADVLREQTAPFHGESCGQSHPSPRPSPR